MAAHESAARVALALKDAAAATTYAAVSAEVDPTSALPRFVKGRLLFDAGKYEEAVEAFTEPEPADDDEPTPAAVAELELYKGESLARLERTEDAEVAFRNEIEAFPRDPRAYLSLVTLYQSTKPEEIEEVLDDLMEAVPTPEGYGLAAAAWATVGDTAARQRDPRRRPRQVPGRSDARASVRTRWAPISASPTPAQNRFRTFRTTASVTPCAEAIASTGASAPDSASSTPTRNGTNLNAMVMARFSASNTIDCVQVGRAVAHQPAEDEVHLEHRQGVEGDSQARTRPRAAPGGRRRTRAPSARSCASRARHGGPRPPLGRPRAPQQPLRHDRPAGEEHERRQRHSRPAVLSGTVSSATTTPTATIADRRGRVDQVVHRQRRHGVGRRQPGAGEEHLGGLAGRQPERRHAADRVAGEERAAAPAPNGRRTLGPHAQPPGLRAQAEPQAADREDQRAGPAPTRRMPSVMTERPTLRTA